MLQDCNLQKFEGKSFWKSGAAFRQTTTDQLCNIGNVTFFKVNIDSVATNAEDSRSVLMTYS